MLPSSGSHHCCHCWHWALSSLVTVPLRVLGFTRNATGTADCLPVAPRRQSLLAPVLLLEDHIYNSTHPPTMLPILTITLLASLLLSTQSIECDMADGERADSWDKIFPLNAQTCESRGYCWKVHDVPGIPWCYHPKGGSGDSGDGDTAALPMLNNAHCDISSPAETRRECAEPGTPITPEICIANGCCWSPATPGTPWCFHSSDSDDTSSSSSSSSSSRVSDHISPSIRSKNLRTSSGETRKNSLRG